MDFFSTFFLKHGSIRCRSCPTSRKGSYRILVTYCRSQSVRCVESRVLPPIVVFNSVASVVDDLVNSVRFVVVHVIGRLHSVVVVSSGVDGGAVIYVINSVGESLFMLR